MIENLLSNWIMQFGLQEDVSRIVSFLVITLGILIFAMFAAWIVRRTLLPILVRIIHQNSLQWDDPLIKHRFFHKISWFTPLLIIYIAQDVLLQDESILSDILSRALLAGVVVTTSMSISALLSALNEIYTAISQKRSAAIRGYTDAARIILYVFCAIFLISLLTDRSPWGLLSLLGGLTAVILLVFKDTLLGFVANIQLSATNMVQIGDWIEMAQYGADGDVIDISIHCVRVQNWDKTVTSIPTYALISNSFKNWRGMSESGGRRIKRAINIDLSTIRFMTDAEVEKLAEIKILTRYLRPRQKEIKSYNNRHEVAESVAVNGRCQTNIGIFRAYTQEYLRQHPQIHQNMTFIVRQLAPTETGLPLEVYVFSKDQVWANFEAIQSDIFDHLLSALPYFQLRVFQNPSSFDFNCAFKQAE